MRAKSRVEVEQEDTELNMTPMLDVVFILLIFFIVTAVFVKEPGLDVEKPIATDMEQRNPSVLVAVSSSNSIWIDRGEYTTQNVRPILESLKDENPLMEIVLQGDQGADIGTVLDTQEIIDSLGIPVYVSVEQ